MRGLEHILKPIKVRNVEIPNRVVMPPMGTNLGNRDGSVSEANLAYFERRVKSGAGLIITEITSVHPHGTASPGSLAVYDDKFIPGLKKMADAVHKQGGKVAMQLHHAGRESLYQLKKGNAVAPSAIGSYIYRMPPREMTLEDIEETIAAFGSAAVRARKAGFDAVEVHGAHGYLLAQFLSIHSNQRQDKYGGSFLNRARFLIEVLEEIRRQVGNDFPISLRISAEELIKNGYTVEDMQKVVPELVLAGADIIHASFGTHGTPGGITSAPIEYQPGFKVGLAKKIKEVTEVPVIAVGRFTNPLAADEVIARGDADLIAFGRQHLADPDFLQNAINGHPEETFECLACNQGCIERLMFERGKIRCAINPETGQELIYPADKSRVSKRVWIIGAGPGGLTAAYEAARLGHQVTVWEKDEKTGGAVRVASQAPFKQAYATWIDRLTIRAKRAGAEIKLNTQVNGKMIKEQNPDAFILATGGESVIPVIEGINLSHVFEARQVLNGGVDIRDHILVVGAGLVGMETADYCTYKGCRDVTVVEKLSRSPVSTFTAHGYMLHHRLRQAGCQFKFNCEVQKIEPDGVWINNQGQEEKLSPIDQVIIAMGTKSSQQLADVLKQAGVNYQVVGDAVSPRRIIEAVEEGARAVWEI